MISSDPTHFINYQPKNLGLKNNERDELLGAKYVFKISIANFIFIRMTKIQNITIALPIIAGISLFKNSRQ